MTAVSVVIPAYNEKENLQKLIQDIELALNNSHPFEILIVDDCSTDDTRSLCLNLKQTHPHLTYIKHKKNFGQSAGVLTGVKYARFPLIATLDGDGQNPPHEIKKLIAAYEASIGDKAKTLFAGYRKKRNDPWIKRFSSKIANRVRSYFLKDQCPDTGCGLKLFHQATFLELPHFNHMHRFLPALYRRNGHVVVNVPIDHAPRTLGVSKYTTWGRLCVGIIDLFGVAWLARRACYPCVEENSHE